MVLVGILIIRKSIVIHVLLRI